MVRAAAGADGGLLEGPQPGRRLARVEDRDAGVHRGTASTSARVAVAMPERWPRKLSAVRSAATIERIDPATVATTSPGDERGRRRGARRRRRALASTCAKRLERRTPRQRARRLARDESRRAVDGARVEQRAGEVATLAEVLRERGGDGRGDVGAAGRRSARRRSGRGGGATRDRRRGTPRERGTPSTRSRATADGEQRLGAGDEVRELSSLGVPSARARPPWRARARRAPSAATPVGAHDPGPCGHRVLQRRAAPRRRRCRRRTAPRRRLERRPVDGDPAVARRGSRASRRSARRRAPRLERLGEPGGEHHPLEQRVRREAVRAVHPGAGDLADGEEPRERRRAVEVGDDAAGEVVRRRSDREPVDLGVEPRCGEARRRASGTSRRTPRARSRRARGGARRRAPSRRPSRGSRRRAARARRRSGRPRRCAAARRARAAPRRAAAAASRDGAAPSGGTA